MDAIEETGDQDVALAVSQAPDPMRLSMAEAGLAKGECVIHKPGYEPHPARRSDVLDGSCDFEPEMFRDDDGVLPEWLVLFLAEFPRSGAAVGFTASVMRGSYAPWERKPETGLTLGG